VSTGAGTVTEPRCGGLRRLPRVSQAAPPPPQPPALARAVGFDLVTRLRLRLTDARDSRLGELGGDSYQLGAAMWTGRRAAFVGFYTPSPDPAVAGPDLAARCAAMSRWGAERLAIQGADRCDALIIALGEVPGALTGPTSDPAVHVGAVTVDPRTAEVGVLLPPPPELLTPREIHVHAQALLGGGEAPTLAAVDLAERQAIAAGYAAPARTQLATIPVATYALIASFIAIFLVEKVLLRNTSTFGLDMGALSYQQPDWWRFISYAFLHDPGGGGIGGGLPLHVIFNSFAMYIVGRLVEQLYGWRVLLGTFLLAAVGGGAASALVGAVSGGATPTIGASAGIMGLLGLLFVLGRVQGRDVPAGIAHGMRQYAVRYAAMVIVFGFLVPNVDNAAHVGGFITGALVGLAVPPLSRVGGRDLRAWERWAGYAVYAGAAAALLFAVIHVAGLLGTSPGFTTAPA